MFNMSSPPIKPDDSECCGSGCNPCIFEVYEEMLEKWKMKQVSPQVSFAFSQSKFLPFLIQSTEMLAHNIKFFEFRPVKLIDEGKSEEVLLTKAKDGRDYEIIQDNLNLKAGHYLILKGQYQTVDENNSTIVNKISRSYTPILNECTKQSFKVIVALYPDGKMSQFLNKLNKNDIVFWRGPYQEYVYTLNSYKKILMFGGGTGVIPLYNLAKEIVENDLEETRIKFVASFQNMESIILREELNKLLDYWNFQLNIYITKLENLDFKIKYNENVMFSKLSEILVREELCFYEENECFILVCGPKLFSSFIYNTVLQYGAVKENIYVYK